MYHGWTRWLWAGVLGAVGVLFGDFDVQTVEARTIDSWISVGAGNWHSAGNWSAGRIPINTDSVFLTNAIGGTTNYLDAGAITNFPSLYYRIRLVP